MNAEYNFTTEDMIQTSLNTWLKYGFNYTAPIDNSIDTVLAMSTDDIMGGGLWAMDGVFTLPVCHWGAGEDDVPGFFYKLNSPTNGGSGAPAR